MIESLTMNVLYQSDKNTQYYMGVSIYSLLLNNKSDYRITVYIIDNGLDVTFINELYCLIKGFNAEIRLLDGRVLKEYLEKNKFPDYLGTRKNKKSYYKLFWDIVITDKLSRLIYIDCDTVVQREITNLVNINMRGNVLGMVCDALITDEAELIGIKQNDYYYNSGMILFDADKWISDKCSSRVMEHAKKNNSYGTVDQDLINIEFCNQITKLPICYNVQSIHMITDSVTYCREFKRKNYYNICEINQGIKEACIIHFLKFIGKNPWDKGSKHPCRKIFFEYLQNTPWKELAERKVQTNIVYLIEEILFLILPNRFFVKVFHFAHSKMIAKSNKGVLDKVRKYE
mgnify:CR=1 FL=1|jgi:lipopolysaccharide biosynthesis glycosyltransferase